MDGFGSRWTPGGFSGAMRPTADRPSVVPNDGGPRAWAVTGCGRARPATPPVSHRARNPNNAVRCCARANDVRANVYAAPTSRCAMGSSAGDEQAPRSRSTRAGRCPHRATREWGAKKALRLKWWKAARRHGRNSAMLRSSTSGKTSGVPNGLRRYSASPSGSKLGFGAVPKVPLAAKRISVQ